jgi:TAP-like protein
VRLVAQSPAEDLDPSSGDSDALFLATTCAELPWPWSPADGLAGRLAQARRQTLALPRTTFAPFDLAQGYRIAGFDECGAWPGAPTAAAAPAPPLPDVPALLVAGGLDTPTPVADAEAVARRLPRSHLIVLSEAGHDPLSYGDRCGDRAVTAFLTGGRVAGCRPRRADLFPERAWPRTLRAVRPFPHVRGRRGRVVAAAARTVDDAVGPSPTGAAGCWPEAGRRAAA